MTWFADHSSLIQTLTAIATALIWAVYLQMLLSGVLRQRRPTLSINRGSGEGLEAQIILSNLGYEPIYVQDVLVALGVDGEGTRTYYVTDRRELSAKQAGEGLGGTTQGPMKMGGYISLGTVQGILSRAASNYDSDRLPGLNEITFIILGTGQKPGGARKSYRVTRDRGEVQHLIPNRLDTERLSARTCRRIHADQGSDV